MKYVGVVPQRRQNILVCPDRIYLNRLEEKHHSRVSQLTQKMVNKTMCVYACNVSVVVGMDAELDELSVDDVRQTEDVIVSEWRDVSANERHRIREQVDEIVRPLGLQTRLVVLERANSIAVFFLCMTLSAFMSLRDQWNTRKLRDTVQSLFTLLSGATRQVLVRRLTWPLADYERCLELFSYLQSKLNDIIINYLSIVEKVTVCNYCNITQLSAKTLYYLSAQ